MNVRLIWILYIGNTDQRKFYSVHAAAATAANSTATGVNYFKAGEDPPLKEDSEYPDWLWNIADPPPSLFTLERKYPEDEPISDNNFTDVSPLLSLQHSQIPSKGDMPCHISMLAQAYIPDLSS